MGLLDRFRGRGNSSKADGDAEKDHECLHGVLVAHWAEAADMGDESKATEFVCQSCAEHFTPDKAEWVRKRAIERLRR